MGTAPPGSLQVAAYKNGNPLQPYGSAINANAYSQFLALNNNGKFGATDLSGWDSQMVEFLAADADLPQYGYIYGPPTTIKSLTVSQLVTFEIPIVFGTPFQLGIFADAKAGDYSSGSYPTTDDVDFSHTLTVAGSGVLPPSGTGTPNSNFVLSSTSGFQYAQAVPEPRTLLPAALVLLLGILLNRRRRLC